MNKHEEKLLEVIEQQNQIIKHQSEVIEEQRREIKLLEDQLSVTLERLAKPLPGYQYGFPGIVPCDDADRLNIRGPSDYPPVPSITCEPDPDHLPYGYNPKDPLNSRSVSL